ncbi:uncharacterized protein LOC143443455 [Arvicanthis niloticus]|uniref:uncharacterized protein LOC143313694 n=1 Tax=Arvicanthis niloticus TaxID=61156 RepID=UPI00402B9521
MWLTNQEELGWNFDGDCIESVDCFWQDGHFTILILPINEHERSFHILRSSIFFLQGLEVLLLTDKSILVQKLTISMVQPTDHMELKRQEDQEKKIMEQRLKKKPSRDCTTCGFILSAGTKPDTVATAKRHLLTGTCSGPLSMEWCHHSVLDLLQQEIVKSITHRQSVLV